MLVGNGLIPISPVFFIFPLPPHGRSIELNVNTKIKKGENHIFGMLARGITSTLFFIRRVAVYA